MLHLISSVQAERQQLETDLEHARSELEHARQRQTAEEHQADTAGNTEALVLELNRKLKQASLSAFPMLTEEAGQVTSSRHQLM